MSTVSCRSEMASGPIVVISPIVNRLRLRTSPLPDMAATATPSPYPGGVQGDLQDEQEDLGTRLEGKFDGATTRKETVGKAKKKTGKKKRTSRPLNQ